MAKKPKMTPLGPPLAKRHYPEIIAESNDHQLMAWKASGKTTVGLRLRWAYGAAVTRALSLVTNNQKTAAKAIVKHFKEFEFPKEWEWDCIVDPEDNDEWDSY